MLASKFFFCFLNLFLVRIDVEGFISFEPSAALFLSWTVCLCAVYVSVVFVLAVASVWYTAAWTLLIFDKEVTLELVYQGCISLHSTCTARPGRLLVGW